MKRILQFALAALFFISCSSTPKIETDIVDYVKNVANDPSSVEIVDYKLMEKTTVSDCYDRLPEMRLDIAELLKWQEDYGHLQSDTTTVSYCYKVDFRAKNALDALVKNQMFILYDKNMEAITHSDGMLGLNDIQVQEILKGQS
jgi:hypothetical protein